MINFGAWILLADASKFRSMGNNFRGEKAELDLRDVMIGLVCLALVAAFVVLLTRLRAVQEQRRRTNSPNGLFQELCRAHGLDRSGRQVLWAVVKKQKLEPPARLFLEPQHLEQARQNPAAAGDASQLQSLARQIFGDSPTRGTA